MCNRIIDLSIGTAKALNFYGHGLAHVRVELSAARRSKAATTAPARNLARGAPAPARQGDARLGQAVPARGAEQQGYGVTL
jgi:rare lipoprotein A (peptidoglycan hydrolase)